MCVCTSAPSLAHAGFLGLGHPVIFGRHGNRPEVTWKDQSVVRESAVGGGSGGVATERQRRRQLEGWTGETRCVPVRGGRTGEYDVQGKGHMALCSGFSLKLVCDSGSKLQNHRRPIFNAVNASCVDKDDALKLLLC